MIKLNARFTITSDDTDDIILFTDYRSRLAEMVIFLNLTHLYIMNSHYRLNFCCRYDSQSYYELAWCAASWDGNKLRTELLFPEQLQEYEPLVNTVLINSRGIASVMCQYLQMSKRIQSYMGIE